jgi:catechol 2,3-dioxygenase-like lactoylglutathione lyase family enzyme
MKLSRARLLVDDFGAAFRFYRDELGLTPSFGDESAGYASFAAGDGTIAIFDRSEQGEVVPLRQPGDATIVVFEVDDAAGLAERWRAHVVAGPVEQPDWGGRVLYLRDPSGNLLELFESIPMESA